MGTSSRRTIAALLATGLAALAVTPAAAFGDPAGNNGTVKISQVAVDSVPDNAPHVGCQLHVQWYGFDLGATSRVSFKLVAPTQGSLTVDGPLTVDVGGDPAGGGRDLDGDVVYVMHPRAIPQPQQGFHARITIETTWSNGSQKKSKVIWFKGCDATPAAAPTTTPASAPSAITDGTLTVVPLSAVKTRHRAKPVKVPTKVESGLAHRPSRRR